MDVAVIQRPRPIPILLYHSIDAVVRPAYARWAMPSETFRRHLQIIAAEGYRPVTLDALSQMMDGPETPDKLVCITFDDGLMDFVTGAMPVLQEFGCPATLFLVTGFLGGKARWLASSDEADRPMMAWSDVREVAREGIECGAHSVSHRELDTLPGPAARDEIFNSKRAIEDKLGQAVRSFAYPYGYASATTKRLVREAGFHAACRVNHGLSAKREDRFGLSRIIVTGDHTDDEMRAFLAGRTLPMAPPQSSLRQQGWRAYRRLRAHLARSDRPGPRRLLSGKPGAAE
ncbi:MAG: polysaccharide deacetylase family protein [Maritimibacter sp.]|nr:polysaccharide deacetylase family protein [Maritimibacter sp.]